MFASDFRPGDFWPTQDKPLEAILVCSRTLEHIISPWDDKMLTESMRPDYFYQPKQELQKNLASGKNALPLFVTVGRKPDFFGQPIAIAFYSDNEKAFFAHQYLRELSQFQTNYKHNPDLGRRFSMEDDFEGWTRLQLPQTAVGAISYLNTDEFHPAVEAKKPALYPVNEGEPAVVRFHEDSVIDDKAQKIFNQVRKMLTTAPDTIEHETRTPLGDNGFLELEAGIGWYDKANRKVRLVVGSQNLLGEVNMAERTISSYFDIKIGDHDGEVSVDARNNDIGGGFGGRNGSIFAGYLAIAAFHADGKPVRLAWDRFQQFLLGLKRHSSIVRSRLKIDPVTKKFEALEAFLMLGAGILPSLTNSIVGLGTLHLIGPYRIPSTSLHGVGVLRPQTPSGPSRGFGIPQACLHLETLMDRAAHRLNIEPIELRKINVFCKQNPDPSGYPLNFHVANKEVLDRAAQHPLWINRQERQEMMRAKGLRYGVGFAMNMEAYGASTDDVFGAVELMPDGRVIVYSDAPEMGQGSRTTLALAIQSLLGVLPGMDEIRLSQTGYFEKTFDKTFKHSNSTASRTAFIHLHPIREACELLMTHGVLKAAQSILKLAELPTDYEWVDGALRVAENTIPRADLVQRIYSEGLWTGVQCHAFFRNGWQSGKVADLDSDRFIDGLAARYGQPADWHSMPVTFVKTDTGAPQRSLYAAAAHLVEITINPSTGQLNVLSCHSILDAGDVLCLPIVEGQAEGGFAMGLGFALTEGIPDDPREVDFMNFHTYRSPRFKSMAPIQHTLELIPLPPGETILGSDQPLARSKGIAEAVMTTVAPAVANAVAHATGNYAWLARVHLPLARLSILNALEDAQ